METISSLFTNPTHELTVVIKTNPILGTTAAVNVIGQLLYPNISLADLARFHTIVTQSTLLCDIQANGASVDAASIAALNVYTNALKDHFQQSASVIFSAIVNYTVGRFSVAVAPSTTAALFASGRFAPGTSPIDQQRHLIYKAKITVTPTVDPIKLRQSVRQELNGNRVAELQLRHALATARAVPFEYTKPDGLGSSMAKNVILQSDLLKEASIHCVALNIYCKLFAEGENVNARGWLQQVSNASCTS